ncbi:MAG: hypothetical protein ACTIKR_18265 [Advenella sp.]|uniref:hypothetical protein n=1 Tax=Advenella sp. TaxID=1872388 RepID=UPI003F976653
MEDTSSQATPYPTLLAILKFRTSITISGGAILFLAVCWLGFRLGIPDLYALAMAIGVVVYFALKAAIEVVDLIAETLMPR